MASKSAKRRKARKPGASPSIRTAADRLMAETETVEVESPYGSSKDRVVRRKDIIRDMEAREMWDAYQVAAAERYRRSWDIVRAGGPRCGERVGGGKPGMGESEAVLAAACDLRQARAEVGATVAAALDLVLGEGETITTAADRILGHQACLGIARKCIGLMAGDALSRLSGIWGYGTGRPRIRASGELTVVHP